MCKEMLVDAMAETGHSSRGDPFYVPCLKKLGYGAVFGFGFGHTPGAFEWLWYV